MPIGGSERAGDDERFGFSVEPASTFAIDGVGGVLPDDVGGSCGFVNATSAASKRVGNVLPRLSARRRIPCAALWLKKNLWGTRCSKMSDNVDATASLGDSEILAVEHTPRKAVPEFGKRFDDLPHGFTFVLRQEARNVLDKDPSRLSYRDHTGELEEEARSLAPESRAAARDREVLAGEPSADEVDLLEFPSRDVLDVREPRRAWPVPCEDAPSVLIDFYLPFYLDSCSLESEIHSSPTGEERSCCECQAELSEKSSPKTFVTPACVRSLRHPLQGVLVTARCAPSVRAPRRAASAMQFISA